jgi:GPH family glycoside/pentoside/hexuronide:cation symporter
VKTLLRGELPAIGYASGNFGKNLLWAAGEVTLLFLLTEVAGIPPAIAGALLFASLLLDILIDVTAGRLAAGAEARGIGYRGRMLVAAMPCAAGFALLYALPAAGWTGPAAMFGALLLFRAGYGFVDVPHNALLARVATDSRRRGRIAGYRSLFSALGSLAVAGLLAPAVIGAATGGDIARMAMVGTVAALLFLLAILSAWISTAEVDRPGASPSPADRSPVALQPRLRGDLLRLLLVAVVTGFAMPMLGRNMLHLATYGFGAPGTAPLLLTALTAGQIAGIACWAWLTHRTEKRNAWGATHLASAGAVALFALVPPEARPAAAALAGFALAGVFMLPWAVIGDLVDADHVRDGERREAQSFAALLAALKGGAALGLMTSGWTLDQSGIGGRPVDGGLVLALAILPVMVGGMLSALLIAQLQITHGEHARIRRTLEDS